MNLGGKLSGLKGLVTTHSQGKRRLRGDLTPDMISPPLGDFRHTMHVGRGGDVFGDTSFLSNHGGTANGSGDADSVSTSTTTSPENKIGAFFSRTLRHVRKTPETPRGGSRDLALSPAPPPVSPIIKNAISLPRLDVDLSNGALPLAKTLFSSPGKTLEETSYSYGLESGFVTLPRLSRSERQQPSISTSCSRDARRGSLTHATDAILSLSSAPTLTSDPDLIRPGSLTSLTSFTFDLGPSLMSEVFSLIDSPNSHQGARHAWERDELEPGPAYGGFSANEGSEMDSATISLVDSLLREDCGSTKSPYGAEWTEEEEEDGGWMKVNGGQHPLKGAVPDLVLGSPARERLGMESGRFQSASDVLARHYGVGGLLKGQPPRIDVGAELRGGQNRKMASSYSYTDDDEEIKV